MVLPLIAQITLQTRLLKMIYSGLASKSSKFNQKSSLRNPTLKKIFLDNKFVNKQKLYKEQQLNRE